MASVRTMGNVIAVLRSDTIDNGNIVLGALTMNKDIDIVRKNQTWEVGNVTPVYLPDETYGECKKANCHNVGELGNGICQKCWDIGSGSRVGIKRLGLPNISLAFPEVGG